MGNTAMANVNEASIESHIYAGSDIHGAQCCRGIYAEYFYLLRSVGETSRCVQRVDPSAP